MTKGDDGNAVTLTVAFSDGNGHSFRQSIDPVCAAMLSSSSDSSGDVDHHVFAFNVDAGPIMVTTMVDGVLCDGGGRLKRLQVGGREHGGGCGRDWN